MRCPKCQYLSVDDASRCRNCGHTFAVTGGTAEDAALALRPDEPVGPMLDLELHGDALLGSDAEGTSPEPLVPPPADMRHPGDNIADVGPLPAAAAIPSAELPLFLEGSVRTETTRAHVPPARPPLSVRRPTVTPRPRPTPASSSAGSFAAAPSGADGTPRSASGAGLSGAVASASSTLPQTRAVHQAHENRPVGLPLDGADLSGREPQAAANQSAAVGLSTGTGSSDAFVHADRSTPLDPIPVAPQASTSVPEDVAPWSRRLGALLVDLVILGLINGVVLSFTSRIVGLPLLEFPRAAVVPLAAFLLALNYAYAFSLVAVAGQTLGKMAFGLKVVSVDGRDIDAGGAALRALFAAVTVLLAGLPYLFALGDAYGRAPHDRVAGTRVVTL